VRSWLQVLDALYFTFTIRPYAGKLSRTLKAEPKLYLFDILRIPAEYQGKRLENLTALHLLKACQFWTDTAQGDYDLRFVRTRDGLEVDFLVLADGKPWMLLECKTGAKEPSKLLRRFGEIWHPTPGAILRDLTRCLQVTIPVPATKRRIENRVQLPHGPEGLHFLKVGRNRGSLPTPTDQVGHSYGTCEFLYLTRTDRHHKAHGASTKLVYVYPLCHSHQQCLCDPLTR
jgi:hypothetical protein